MDNSQIVLKVIVHQDHLHRVRITCRCGRQWIEVIPEELHNAQWLGVEFECSTCSRVFRLLHKQLRCITSDKEVTDGGPKQTHVYDA